MAPTRKTDPGELFPWERLAGKGIGLWPGEADNLIMDRPVLADALREIGYDVTDFNAALKAFQRHFRPDRVTGRIDPETARRILGLVEVLRRDEDAVS